MTEPETSLSPRSLPRSVWVLGAVSLLTDVSSDMSASLLPLFLATLAHGGAASLGWIEGAASTTAALFKYVSGTLADRTSRKKPLVVLGYSISSLVRPLLAVATAPWQVLWVRVIDRVGKGIRSSPRDAILAADTPPAQRAYAFGLHRAMDNLGAVIGPLLATVVLHLWPARLRLGLGVAAIPGALAVLVLVLGVRETPIQKAVSEKKNDAPAEALSPQFKRYLAVSGLFALADASDLFLLVRARDLGVAAENIPLVWGLLSLLRAIGTVPGGRLADRLGRAWALSLGWTLYAVAYVGFGLSHSVYEALGALLIYGLYYGLTEGAQRALVAGFADKSALGRAYGSFNLVTGLAALPASMWFGWVYDRDHGRTAFLAAGAMALLASLGLRAMSSGAGDDAPPSR